MFGAPRGGLGGRGVRLGMPLGLRRVAPGAGAARLTRFLCFFSAVRVGSLGSQKEEAPPGEKVSGVLPERQGGQDAGRVQLPPPAPRVRSPAAARPPEGEGVSPRNPEQSVCLPVAEPPASGVRDEVQHGERSLSGFSSLCELFRPHPQTVLTVLKLCRLPRKMLESNEERSQNHAQVIFSEGNA